MPSKVYSAAVVGVEAFEVEIEVHARWGNTDKIAVVGLPDTAVKESKDRVTSAISNSSFRWPYGKRITINLAPADVRKEGPSFDPPIALGMLKLEENNRLPTLDAYCITGELALSGQCDRLREFSRSPWKRSAGGGRLSSCRSRMLPKPRWWKVSMFTERGPFRRSSIFCVEI
jgi:predicted ATPase with chaperone activity